MPKGLEETMMQAVRTTICICLTVLTVFIATARSTSAVPVGPARGLLSLHPDNPHYFQFRGEPAVLITSGEHYGAVINLDFSFATNHPRGTLLDHRGPGGGGPALRRQLQILKEFINSFEFVTMKPDDSVIKGGVPAKGRAWALAEPGRAYAIYIVGRGPAQLILELPEGEFRGDWIDPADGSIDAREDITHGGGPRQLQSPDFDQDIALSIKTQ